jgi:hypothetical protein
VAFTEHGALMAANILNSPRAVAMSVYVNADARLWKKLEPRRRARRKLRPHLSQKRLKELALREFAIRAFIKMVQGWRCRTNRSSEKGLSGFWVCFLRSKTG